MLFLCMLPHAVPVYCLELWTVQTTKTWGRWRKIGERRRTILTGLEIINVLHSRQSAELGYSSKSQIVWDSMAVPQVIVQVVKRYCVSTGGADNHAFVSYKRK